MCGVAAVFSKRRRDSTPARAMVEMLELLRHRGEDATGIAVYTAAPREHHRLRLSCRNLQQNLVLAREIVSMAGRWVGHQVQPTHSVYQVVEADIDLADDQVPAVYRQLDAQPDLCVHSFSKTLTIYKDVGPARHLASFGGLQAHECSHMVGHVRLATESIDNLNFAHPFSSPLRPDLSIVHNGQLTNYFNLRRKLSAKGIPFKTFNDSELIAHYVAFKTAVEGCSLAEALHQSVDDLDGVYSYVVSTATEIGAVQDRLGLKPIVIYETDDQLLLGSEQLCFSVLDSDAAGIEITPGEVRVWSNSIVPA